MPRITKANISIRGERCTVNICYSQKQGFHAIGLPDEVAALSQTRVTGCETQGALEEAIKSVVKEYEEAKKTQRKVIFYYLRLSSELVMNKDANYSSGHSYKGYKPWVPENIRALCGHSFHSIEGKGFAIDWEVLLEIVKAETVYHRENPDGSVGYKAHIPSGSMIIDWTPEREAGFVEIDAAMERMVKILTEIIGYPDRMVQLLDSGTKLLPG